MSDERQAFLDAIAADPYDVVTRKVFADWLDEHDEPELADYQRSWTKEKYDEAKAWLTEFAEECWLTYEELINASTNYLDYGEGYCLATDTPDRVSTDSEDLWKHFYVVTGRSVPEEQQGDTFFRCAC